MKKIFSTICFFALTFVFNTTATAFAAPSSASELNVGGAVDEFIQVQSINGQWVIDSNNAQATMFNQENSLIAGVKY